MPVCVSMALSHHAGGMSSKHRTVTEREREKQKVSVERVCSVLPGGDEVMQRR